MNREEYEGRLRELKENAEDVCVDGLSLLVKECADRERGCMDPRALRLHTLKREEAEEHPEQVEECLKKNFRYLFPAPPLPGESMIETMRRTMGWESEDITDGKVEGKNVVIPGRGGEISVRIYTPAGGERRKPCLLFFHGGGFTGGSMDVVENPCKAIAGRGDAVVINVDYRLAPENPYPAGLHDCMDAVGWVWENAETLGIRQDKIGVAGDSAGGGLASSCVYLDRAGGENRIAYQVLLYPTVTRSADPEVNGYTWSMDVYENRDDHPGIRRALTWMMESMDGLNQMYMGDAAKITEPGASPLLAEDFTGYPPTLMVTAEYDYLRLEAEMYARKLAEAGASVRVIRYGGMEHAFLDKCGFYPQAEDCVDEIAEAVRRWSHE